MKSASITEELISKLIIPNIKQVVEEEPSLHFEDGFLIREFIKGQKYLVIQADKIEESKKFMVDNHITGLEINMSLGYPSLSIEFIKDFSFLTRLTVIHLPLRKTDEINSLHNLESLDLNCYFYSELDFDNFPQLDNCYLYWTPKAKNLFNRKTLKSLIIDSYKGKDAHEFAQLSNLETLKIIKSSTASIDDLAQLKKLKLLALILLRNLTSLKGLENLSNLEDLTIDNCRKITTVEEISRLINLKTLSLSNDGEIASLKPLEHLVNLEHLYFIEDTKIIDGDLMPIAKLKNLKEVLFMNRKHYTHKRDLRTNTLIANN